MISTSLFCAKPETKIVLFNSPIYSESQDDKEEHLPPLGLGYIATELNRAGIPVEIVDCVYAVVNRENIIARANTRDMIRFILFLHLLSF